MKLIKFGFIVAVAVMAIIGVSTTSYAFHSGGVASCESCHTMHNSLNNGAMTGLKSTTQGAAGTANPAGSAIFLLRGSDQSSTCLNCHEATDQSSYHVSAPNTTLAASANTPINYGPGGDFSWLKSATTTTVVATSTLNRRGHNIVAADFSYNADTENTTAPGGTFSASNLNCISCHNPHNQLRRTSDTSNTYVKPAVGTNVYAIAGSGSASNAAVATATAPLGPYRFLRGAGADQAPLSTGYAFNANPPAVMSPNTYNRSEATAQTHVAYGSGMSDWCGNCHSGMNNQTGSMGSGAHPHPVNKALGATYAANYNAYKGSGDLTNATGGYSSLVPVEMGTEDYGTLKAAASSANGGNYLAITATAKVMCLSCHRAHASGFASMTRFNVAGNTTAANGTDYVTASGMTNTTQALAAYYQQPATQFTANTKQLCNKCHVKD
jgi:hypothetical protein